MVYKVNFNIIKHNKEYSAQVLTKAPNKRLKPQDFKVLNRKMMQLGSIGYFKLKENGAGFRFAVDPTEKLKNIEIELTGIYRPAGRPKKASATLSHQMSGGGLIEGKSHANGGVKAIITDTNTPIEVEGGEVVINKNTVQSQQKFTFENKTAKEILDELNQAGGGVPILEKGGMVSDFNKNSKPGQLHPSFLNNSPIVLGKEINIIMPNGEKHKSSFAIVDIDHIIASHDETTFKSSIGYPLNSDGTNINDRNYFQDVNAQKLVNDYARNLEPERIIVTSRTPSGSPIITKDGIVVSGNNRTMSTKLAVKKYPEKYKKYLEFLDEEYLAFGFDPAKRVAILNKQNFLDERNPSKSYSNLPLIKINNPFLVRIDYDFEEYTTEQLAKYNKDTKKSERPIDKAIKLSNILRNNKLVFSKLSDIIAKYETFTEFYSNSADTLAFAKALIENGILTQQELPAFFESGIFTEQGKDFIEQMLAAMVLNRESLIATNLQGVRKYRQTLITSLTVLIANTQLKEGNLNDYINSSILFAYEMAKNNSTFFDILNQQQLFKKVLYNRKAVVLNRLLDSGRNTFKQTIEKYNETIKREENSGLFGDKLGPEQIFKLIVETKISKQDLMIIDNSKLITDKDIVEQPEVIDMPPMKDGIRLIDSGSIDKLEAYLKTLKQTKELNTIPGTDFYTNDRNILHDKIISEARQNSVCIRREQPIAILTGGLPGSGKSTFLKKYSEYLVSEEIFKIDADEIRSKLPEYKGWNADQTHKESSDIVNKLLDNCKKAVPCKYDILYDGTMNKAKSYIPLIEKLKSLGYKTFIIFIEIPSKIARERVLKRYQETGRYVPRQVIDEGIENGLTAFDELKQIVDGYMLVDGETQKITDKKGEQLPKDRVYFDNDSEENILEKAFVPDFDKYKKEMKLEYRWKNDKTIRELFKLKILSELYEKEIDADNFGTGIRRKINSIKEGLMINVSNVKFKNEPAFNHSSKKIKELIEEAFHEGRQIPSEILKEYPELQISKDNPSGASQISSNQKLHSKIKDFTALLDITDNDEDIKKIKSKIKGFEALLDIEKFAEGGEINKSIENYNFPIEIKLEDINYKLAYDAYRGVSFDPEKRAKSTQEGYVEDMQEFNDEFSKIAINDRQKEIFIERFKQYKDLYIKLKNAILNAKGRTLSSMITGPANFPVARNQKALDVEHKRYVEFTDKISRFKENTFKMINNAKSETEKEAEHWESIKKTLDDKINTITNIDKGKNTYTSRSLIVQNLQGFISRMAKNGQIEDVRQSLDYIKKIQETAPKKIFADNNAVWKLVSSIEKFKEENKQKIEQIQKVFKYNGAELLRNFDNDRVQIFFDKIPSVEIRNDLKSKAFKWSPFNKAWQRKNTISSVYDSKNILEKHFGKEIIETNELTGGLSDNLTIEQIAEKHDKNIAYMIEQLEAGINVELEHTNDKDKAKEIAMDHLTERPDYYIMLNKMESKDEPTGASKSVSSKQKLQSKIKGLKALLDITDNEQDIKKIKSKIKGFEALMDID